jgi:hypothetical protein
MKDVNNNNKITLRTRNNTNHNNLKANSENINNNTHKQIYTYNLITKCNIQFYSMELTK